MKEEELLREVEEIRKEISEDEEIVDGKNRKNPFWIILGLMLALLVILMIIPYYSLKLDPEPEKRISLEEIDLSHIKAQPHNYSITRKEDFLLLLTPNDADIKRIADKVATYGCDSNKVCQAKSIYYFVRDNFDYVSDPTSFEYIKSAKESLISEGGDCDDMSVLLANLLNAIGIETRFVFVPNHVYVQAKIDDALRRYKENGWVNLDAACKNCKFGELGFSYIKAEKYYI